MPMPVGAAPSRHAAASRRAACAGLAAAALSSLPLLKAAASEEEELIDVYFGCGCFWHVQHEFVEAERKILGRKDAQITARAGTAMPDMCGTLSPAPSQSHLALSP